MAFRKFGAGESNHQLGRQTFAEMIVLVLISSAWRRLLALVV